MQRQPAWGKWTGAHNIGGSQTGSALPVRAAAAPARAPTSSASPWTVRSSPPRSRLSAINGGTTQISGNFTQSSANQLANQLKYGALPLSFRTDANETRVGDAGHRRS